MLTLAKLQRLLEGLEEEVTSLEKKKRHHLREAGKIDRRISLLTGTRPTDVSRPETPVTERVKRFMHDGRVRSAVQIAREINAPPTTIAQAIRSGPYTRMSRGMYQLKKSERSE